MAEEPARPAALKQAARLGILTEYRDGLGRRRVADPEALARIVEVLEPRPSPLQGEGGVEPPPRPSPLQGEGDPPRVGTGLKLAPTQRCWQGASQRRHWAFAVQLYGVRSQRNWGHGDFTDLRELIELAADL